MLAGDAHFLLLAGFPAPFLHRSTSGRSSLAPNKQLFLFWLVVLVPENRPGSEVPWCGRDAGRLWDRGSGLSLKRQFHHHSSVDTPKVIYNGTVIREGINPADLGCAFCWVQGVWLSCQQHGPYLFIPQDYLTGTGTSQPAGLEIHLISSHLVSRRLFCSSFTLHPRSSLCFACMFNSQPSCVFQESYCQIQSPAHGSPAKPSTSPEERLGEADTQHRGLECKL